MAMLAEPKTKQKWSNDPRNTTWTNDTSRFGYQMLSKMGWESGKGLGAKEDGTTTHVKSVKRRDNLGLGADKSNGDNWLSHQLAFDDLLSKLNDNRENGSGEDDPKKKKKKHEMEKTARQSRKRVFYNRFIQSKDLSSKSAKDMACIFGQRSKSAPGTPQEQSEAEDSDTSTESCPPAALHGVQTINSGQNIQEYFEKKMKEMKAARAGKMAGEEIANKEQASVGGVQETVFSYPEIAEEGSKLKKKKKEKERKRKTTTEDVELGSNESCLQLGEDECLENEKKKNAEEEMKFDEESDIEVQEARSEERKNKKRKERNIKVTDSEICEGDEVQSEFKEHLTTEGMKIGKTKDKRKKKKDKNTTPVELEISSDRRERKDKKNKVKKPRDPSEEQTCEMLVLEVEERKIDKGKKRKRKEKCDISHNSGSDEITVNEDGGRKKKKKDKSKNSEKKRQQ